MMKELTELDKLENYLKANNIEYERIDKRRNHMLPVPEGFGEYHQICVPAKGNTCKWDVICHYGSYGFEEGLLELMGDLVTETEWGENDSVVGYLTAEDIIERLEANAN